MTPMEQKLEKKKTQEQMQSTLQEHYDISETNKLKDRLFTQENENEDEL